LWADACASAKALKVACPSTYFRPPHQKLSPPGTFLSDQDEPSTFNTDTPRPPDPLPLPVLLDFGAVLFRLRPTSAEDPGNFFSILRSPESPIFSGRPILAFDPLSPTIPCFVMYPGPCKFRHTDRDFLGLKLLTPNRTSPLSFWRSGPPRFDKSFFSSEFGGRPNFPLAGSCPQTSSRSLLPSRTFLLRPPGTYGPPYQGTLFDLRPEHFRFLPARPHDSL